MIYFPLSILMLAGLQEILIVSTPRDVPLYKQIFGDGQQLGMQFEYAVQSSPRGLADAFIIGKEFIGNNSVALALGDNIFYGPTFEQSIQRAAKRDFGATIFATHVEDPENYGVVELSANGTVLGIQEKPKTSRSSLAIPGLYFFDRQVVRIAADLKPSERGELEITDILRHYWKLDQLQVEPLGSDVHWFDAGTHDSLLAVANFVHELDRVHGIQVACLEEIAYQRGLIDTQQLRTLAAKAPPKLSQYLTELTNRNCKPT
jgi:glucose-1-phosphate thymidylyltransferase